MKTESFEVSMCSLQKMRMQCSQDDVLKRGSIQSFISGRVYLQNIPTPLRCHHHDHRDNRIVLAAVMATQKTWMDEAVIAVERRKDRYMPHENARTPNHDQLLLHSKDCRYCSMQCLQ